MVKMRTINRLTNFVKTAIAQDMYFLCDTFDEDKEMKSKLNNYLSQLSRFNTTIKIERNTNISIFFNCSIWNIEKQRMTSPVKCWLKMNRRLEWLEFSSCASKNYLSTVRNGLVKNFPIKLYYNDEENEDKALYFMREVILPLVGKMLIYSGLLNLKLRNEIKFSF